MSRYNPESDEDFQWVTQAQSGDLEAFDKLVEKHQLTIIGILYRFAPSRSDLEDLTQETFVRAWRGLRSWKPVKPFLYWLKKIAVNVGREFCRKQKNSPMAHLTTLNETLIEEVLATPNQEPTNQSAAEEVQFILSTVSPEDRALLTLLYLNEMPITEIADHFGWSRANAKVKAYRARQRLQKSLKDNDYLIK